MRSMLSATESQLIAWCVEASISSSNRATTSVSVTTFLAELDAAGFAIVRKPDGQHETAKPKIIEGDCVEVASIKVNAQAFNLEDWKTRLEEAVRKEKGIFAPPFPDRDARHASLVAAALEQIFQAA